MSENPDLNEIINKNEPTRLNGGTPYIIKPGDTLFNLARRFGYTLDALLAANPGINPRCLRIGKQICLPPSPGSGPFPYDGGSIYILQPGDSLFAIAQRFGYSLHSLIIANSQLADLERLEVGTPICLPI